MDSSCANCKAAFELKTGKRGYFRFSLDNKLPSSSVSAKEALKEWTSAAFTPAKSKRSGNFLCPNCWALLSNAIKYKESVTQFWEKTSQTGYLAGKLPSDVPDDVPITTADILPSTSADITQSTKEAPRKTLFPATKVKRRSSAQWDSIIGAIKGRQYGKAIAGLYRATPASKKRFLQFVKNQIRKEVKQVIDKDFPLCKRVNLPNIEDFSWNDTLDRVQDLAPMLSTTLISVVTTKQNEETLVRGQKRTVNLKPYIGNALAGLLYARAPRTANFLQTIYSIQLWRGGLKRETIDQLSHTGLCLGYDGTIAAIDSLRSGFDEAALKCKKDLERQLSADDVPDKHDDADVSRELVVVMSAMKNIEFEINDPEHEDKDADSSVHADTDEDDGFSTDDDGESEHEDEDDEKDDMDEVEDTASDASAKTMDVDESQDINVLTPVREAEPLHPGFSLCWDNVGKKVTTRHPTAETSNTYINFALSYLAVNRVPSTHLDVSGTDTVTAIEIPKESFLPSQEDFFELRQRMNVVVGRILAQHLSWFKENFTDCVIQHLLHEHSMESTQRSVLVNLGVFEENPSTTQGAIAIYERLQKYLPEVDGKPYPTLVYGDGMSCERGACAIRGRINGLDPQARLEGLQPAAQEFHKEMLLLQDHYDEYFKGSSGGEKGTLFHLKNICNFRNVKSDISDNFSHAWELMCQTTESFTWMLAMQQLGLRTTKDRPSTAPDGIEDESREKRKEYFDAVCQSVTRAIWHTLNTDVLKVEATGQDDLSLYCCNEDLDEDFIGCEKRSHCIKGQWFHYSCAEVDPDNLPTTWYCSDECRLNTDAPYELCYCARNLGEDEPMVGCSAETKCTQKEWYHYRCVGLTQATVPQDDWYCCEACQDICKKKEKKTKKKQKTSHTVKADSKYKYSVAMTWSGLNLLCRRDAVREGDGDAMVCHWVIDLIQFYRKRHYKYVILAHRLLTSINGWLPEKLRHDLRWNRTVNYSGGMGRNLPADLMNELLNRLFKELLKEAKGHYTSQTLARCSQIIGPLGEAMDVVVDSKVMENEVYRHRRRAANRDVNVALIIKLLQNENLFDVRPGREHSSFPAFSHDETPRNAGTFLVKMRELSVKLDSHEGVKLND